MVSQYGYGYGYEHEHEHEHDEYEYENENKYEYGYEHEYGYEETRARQGYEGQVGAEGVAYYAEGYADAHYGYTFAYDEDANLRESTRKVYSRALSASTVSPPSPPPQLRG